MPTPATTVGLGFREASGITGSFVQPTIAATGHDVAGVFESSVRSSIDGRSVLTLSCYVEMPAPTEPRSASVNARSVTVASGSVRLGGRRRWWEFWL